MKPPIPQNSLPQNSAFFTMEQDDLAQARSAGFTCGVFEIQIPPKWMEMDQGAVDSIQQIGNSVELPWRASPLKDWPSFKACCMPSRSAAQKERLVIAALTYPETISGKTERRLTVFEPVVHLESPARVLAEMSPDSCHGFSIACSVSGDIFLAWWDEYKSDFKLFVVEPGSFRPVLELKEPVYKARLLPTPDPVLVLVRRDLSKMPVFFENRAVRVSSPESLFPWPCCRQFEYIGCSDDGVIDIAAEVDNNICLFKVIPDGQVDSSPIEGIDPLEREDEFLSAAMSRKGNVYAAWKFSRSWLRRITDKPRPLDAVEKDAAIMGAVVSDNRAERSGRLVQTAGSSFGRTASGANFAAMAATKNLCLVTRSSTGTSDADYRSYTTYARYYIRIFDPELNPIIGPCSPSILLERSGKLSGEISLIPRSDGSVSMITVAGLEPMLTSTR